MNSVTNRSSINKHRVNPNSLFLAKGSYGCVYHPPPDGCRSCHISVRENKDKYNRSGSRSGSESRSRSGSRSRSREHVCKHGAVKLMDRVSAMEEKRLLDNIVSIDPKGEFHIKLEKICMAPPANELREWPKDNNGIGCPLKLGDNPMLLYFSFGGVPFSVFIKKKNVFCKRDAASLTNITRGLVRFSKKGFVHADLKYDNLMCKIDNDPFIPTVTKFIDFSLSFMTDTRVLPNLSSKNYVFWPPETAVITRLHKYPDEYAMYVRNSILDTLSYMYSKPQKTLIRYINKNTHVIESIVSNMTKWTADRKKFVNTVVRNKFDVFGFGVSLMCMLRRGNMSPILAQNKIFMNRMKIVARAAWRFDYTLRPTSIELHRLYAWAMDALH